ncbi:uncharacterized protein LOC122651234 [Telopea speciosissima]|uniref:uncharacterized protein LOC122651234 n=1 Tax=Telopea speciosissima TaxID=54955 RepID=UPI001CC46B43|nr:uncharacterized protein LOC122651234 [Telopea speciosissima]
MATGWVKSLQCKLRAFEDSVQNLKDVADTTKKRPRKSNPPLPNFPSSLRHLGGPSKAESSSNPSNQVRRSVFARPARTPEPFFPSLTELPEGHPSHNVVEIIFHTSWSPKIFSGQIDIERW